MINRIKQLLNLDDEADPYQRVDAALADLDTAINTICNQQDRILKQEKQITHKILEYSQDYDSKRKRAKLAYQQKDLIQAQDALTESKIVAQQIEQYQKILKEIQGTKQRLLAQKNNFTFTKDQLESRLALGEAQVDASQLKADLSEQLMLINESGELNQFDDLIEEANARSQAIQEIQGNEEVIDSYLEQNSDNHLKEFENEIKQEKQAQLKTSLLNQRKVFEQAFGKIEPSEDPTAKSHQQMLLRELIQDTNSTQEKNDRMDAFFNDQPQSSNPLENEERVNDFFNDPERGPESNRAKEDTINQFFNTK